MQTHHATAKDKPARSRYGFVLFVFGSLLIAWMGLRVLLYLNFVSAHALPERLDRLVLTGLQYDAIVALLLILPLLIWFLIVPEHWMVTRWHRGLVWLACFTGAWLVTLMLIIEYQFFAEFQTRFNSLVLDVATLPRNEWMNVARSYAFGWSLAGSALVALVWTSLAKRLFASMWLAIATPFQRILWVLLTLAGLAALILGLRFGGAPAGNDRVLRELADNGWVALARTVWSQPREYAAHYSTIPVEEAFTRVRKQLTTTNATFAPGDGSLRRQVSGDTARPRLNLVLVIAESLETAFWGGLDGKNQLTPELDRLLRTNVLVFDQLYASGNRTGLGLEGLLASFPPVPRSVGARLTVGAPPDSLARVLKTDGYTTVYLCGGRGDFDGARAVAETAGFDRFLGQDEMRGAMFTTAWGISDEDLFTYALNETRSLATTGQPFLAVVQTVSNQRPFRFPTKPQPGVKMARDRAAAVRYADRTLASFLNAARQEAFATNTIFAIVANHGATVRGSTHLPVRSHIVPLVVFAPGFGREPVRVSAAGSSLDVAPTLLGLIGRPYEAEFFGRDLRQEIAGMGRAPVRHGFDLGVLAGEQLVVLKPNRSIHSFSGNPRLIDPLPPTSSNAVDPELIRDTLALFQVAHERIAGKGTP